MMISFPYPKTQFIRITPHQRRHIENIITDLVALLDFMDGDENLEEGGDDEPSLGWVGMLGAGRNDAYDDREAEDEHDEHGGDDEPSLGWTDHMDQSAAQRIGSLNAVLDGEAESNAR